MNLLNKLKRAFRRYLFETSFRKSALGAPMLKGLNPDKQVIDSFFIADEKARGYQ